MRLGGKQGKDGERGDTLAAWDSKLECLIGDAFNNGKREAQVQARLDALEKRMDANNGFNRRTADAMEKVQEQISALATSDMMHDAVSSALKERDEDERDKRNLGANLAGVGAQRIYNILALLGILVTLAVALHVAGIGADSDAGTNHAGTATLPSTTHRP